MAKYRRITEEQRTTANSTDLYSFLTSHGEQLQRHGSGYKLVYTENGQKHDSITINGNQWYDGFENIGGTSGGYFVYREQGADCINKLVAKYGNDLRNVVVSFPVQAHYSPEYPGAGHVFLIYALIDGIAYYSESFSFGSHAEGSVIAEDVNELIARYSARHGSPSGCVLFSANDLSGPSEDEIAAQSKAEQDAQQAREVIATLEESSDFLFFAEDFKSFDENI